MEKSYKYDKETMERILKMASEEARENISKTSNHGYNCLMCGLLENKEAIFKIENYRENNYNGLIINDIRYCISCGRELNR